MTSTLTTPKTLSFKLLGLWSFCFNLEILKTCMSMTSLIESCFYVFNSFKRTLLFKCQSWILKQKFRHHNMSWSYHLLLLLSVRRLAFFGHMMYQGCELNTYIVDCCDNNCPVSFFYFFLHSSRRLTQISTTSLSD